MLILDDMIESCFDVKENATYLPSNQPSQIQAIFVIICKLTRVNKYIFVV